MFTWWFPRNGYKTLYRNTNIENIEALILKIELLQLIIVIENIKHPNPIESKSRKFHIEPALYYSVS